MIAAAALGLALGSLALIGAALWVLFRALDALDNQDWAE